MKEEEFNKLLNNIENENWYNEDDSEILLGKSSKQSKEKTICKTSVLENIFKKSRNSFFSKLLAGSDEKTGGFKINGKIFLDRWGWALCKNCNNEFKTFIFQCGEKYKCEKCGSDNVLVIGMSIPSNKITKFIEDRYFADKYK